MIFTLCLVSFGIYLGQEYPNLPLIKNVVFSLFGYLKTLQQENQLHQTNELSVNSSSSSLTNLYHYLSSFVKSSSHKNVELENSFVSVSDFSGIYNQRKNLEKDDEIAVFSPDVE